MTTRTIFAITAAAALAAAPATGNAATGNPATGDETRQISEADASGVNPSGFNTSEFDGEGGAIDPRFDFEHVSCRGGENEIRVIVTGVKRSEGLITVDMYPNNQDVFLRGKGRIKKVRYAARAPETKFCVPAPGPGLFAMAVYHDRNANRTFDKTGLGLPAEPWGLSNNPRGLFGPPRVERALFEVGPDGAALEIKLN